ncbi:MAG: hydantoinase B/oxoprolinase family protein, partial [Flavobacteriaceae bacterium]
HNYFKIIRKDGTEERHALGTNIALEKGDIVRCTTATGGGYGNPKDRPREKVLLDIKNGYITPGEAKEYYGV